VRVISYGGGVQSTALLVLASQGELGHVDAALFANVGEQAEDPETLRYVWNVVMPYATSVPVIELHRQTREGERVDLYERITRLKSKSVPIPMRGSDTGKPGKRACTKDYKIKVIGKWLLDRGATPEAPAEVLIGFSKDEAHRMNTEQPDPKWTKAERCQAKSYPLIDRGLTRNDCLSIIAKAGLPRPPKSSCWFCPYHKPSVWAEMKRTRPALFYKSADLEELINARRSNGTVYLTRFGRPLVAAIGAEMQPNLDRGTGPGETCDEGYCWT
jgi:hypothetical protein